MTAPDQTTDRDPYPPIIPVSAAAKMLGIHTKTYVRQGWPLTVVSPRKRVVIVEDLVKAVRERRVA